MGTAAIDEAAAELADTFGPVLRSEDDIGTHDAELAISRGDGYPVQRLAFLEGIAYLHQVLDSVDEEWALVGAVAGKAYDAAATF